MRIEDKILEIINKRELPASEKWLAKTLKENAVEIKKALLYLLNEKKLYKSGKLYFTAKTKKMLDQEKIEAKAEKKNKKRVSVGNDTGTIDSHPDGYAFFMPDSRTGDLFVPHAKMKTAVHGDRVRIKRSKFNGRVEAHVVEILERNISEIVGRVEVRRRHYLVIPLHRKFTQPLFVKNNDGNYKEDDVVLCRIVQYPDKDRDAEGSIIQVLGNINDKGIENRIVMSKYGLVKEFEQDIEDYAAKAAQKLPAAKEKHRTDFRSLYTVTIDGETAKDFDDAISIEKLSNGYNLYVHIADVAHYVEQDSILDEEAYRRGTSVYFPEFAIPMLPEVLSNGVCSLQPQKDRYAMSVCIQYDMNGNRKKTEFYQSVICSDARLTYTKVNEIIAGLPAENKSQTELIKNAVELTSLIKKRRKKQGTIDFDLPDVEFIFNKSGDIEKIIPEIRGISERVIENFMIDTNEVVAEYMDSKLEEAVYRNHGEPELMKIINWTKTLKLFGMDAGKVPDKIKPDTVNKWFAFIDERPYSFFLKSLLVRSMQRAEYQPENLGHFGLASECYTHFTSPIRRYPDLIVHRIMKDLLFKGNNVFTDDYFVTATAHCSTMERNAEDAEREVTLYKKLAYLRKNAGIALHAYINRVVSTGFYVFIEDLMLSGYVDGSTLQGQYHFDTEKGTVLSRGGGEFYKLGDALDVVWLSTDMDRLEASFMPYKKGVQGEIVRKIKSEPVRKTAKKKDKRIKSIQDKRKKRRRK